MIKKEKEVWKSVNGFEGSYEISSFGRVRSLPRTIKNGYNTYREIGNIILKPRIANTYYQIKLCKNGKLFTFNIHQLVGEHFLDKKDNCVINHKDCNPLNNNVSNLEYITQQENVKYAWKNKRCDKTLLSAKQNIIKASLASRKKVFQYDKQNKFINEFDSLSDASRALNIPISGISDCMKGKRKSSYGFVWKGEKINVKKKYLPKNRKIIFKECGLYYRKVRWREPNYI